MKHLLIIPILILFVVSNSFGTEFPIHKYEKWIAKGKYQKAQKKIEELLLMNPEEFDGDYAELWLFRGNCYSLTYFEDVHELDGFNKKPNLLVNRYVEEALYSYKKSYRFGDYKIKRKVVDQMTQLQRFFEGYANKHHRLGNYNQYYINARRARSCNLFLVHTAKASSDNADLIFMLADAAELANRKDEALFLRNKMIESGYKQPELFSKTVALYLEREDVIRALGTLDIGVQLHPKSKELFNQKLNLLKRLNMEVEAIAFLRANVKKFPSYKGELNYLTGLEMQKEYMLDFEAEELFVKIEKNFKKAIRSSPENEEYISALGDLYYTKAVRIKSETADLDKASEKEYLQLLQKAGKTISKAIKLGKGDKTSLTNALQFVNSESTSMVD